MRLGLPFIIDGPMRALRETCLSMMPRISLLEYDKYPNFLSSNMSFNFGMDLISILNVLVHVWNGL